MNQVYKKSEYIVVPVYSDYLVININKVFKEGHTHVKRFDIAKLLIDLAINKELPKNPRFVDNLKRISVDINYIKELEEFKKDEFIDYRELMAAPSYKRHKGALRQVK